MEQNIRKNNIIYASIGVMTLIITIVGATYAYYTATDNVDDIIGGNMATINFDVTITKKTTVDDIKGGLIPMTNSMVQKAVSNASGNGICVDDNNNAVCQVYKITVTNTGSASMFVDGYVTLTGGSGVSTDVATATTTMRWAQAFCTETSNALTSCTTAGKTTTHATTTSTTAGIDSNWTALGSNTSSGHDVTEIKETFSGTNGVTAVGKIQNNDYNVIKTNYIRISKHTGTGYTQQADVTSALVYNQYLSPNDKSATNNTGDSNTTYTDVQVYYIVVWLSETGTNQTVGSGGTNVPALDKRENFFQGTVTFNSAQGSEVTAKFVGYSEVTADTTTSS